MSRFTRKLPRSRKKSNKATEAYATFLRKNMTRAEAYFWKYLKLRQKAWKHKFLPQQVVFGYIPDFYCEGLKLAVEIDGLIHKRKDIKRKDSLRTRRLRAQGVTVVRFSNAHVFTNVQSLMDLLEEICY